MNHFVYLFVGLLAFTFIQAGVRGNNAKGPAECCFRYYSKRIPISRIESYTETTMDCTKPGVVLVTKRGLEICVDPQQSWVSRIMQLIDDRTL